LFKETNCITGMISSNSPSLSKTISNMSVTPNPTSGIFDVNIQLMNTQDAVIEVTDATGRIVLSDNLKNVFGKTVTLSLNGFADGVYFVNLHTQNEVLTKRVVLINQ